MSRLNTVRHELLALHRALLDAQRATHERAHGKVTSSAFLELVIGAPEFAWLRPLTALIVAIDEALEEANPHSPRARRLALIAAKKAAQAGSQDDAAVAQSTAQDAGTGATGGEAFRDTAREREALLLADTRKLVELDADLHAPADESSASAADAFRRQLASALRDTPELSVARASVLRALAAS